MSADEAFSAARNPPYFRSACTALLKVRPCRTDLVRPAEAVGHREGLLSRLLRGALASAAERPLPYPTIQPFIQQQGRVR
jgi:hypothetical protein